MMKERRAIGEHLLADLFGIAPERLAEGDRLGELLEQAAECSGLHPITVPVIIPFHAITASGHAGVTGFIVLAESHIAFHSYPELGFLALDVFTCGPNARPQAALEVFVEELKPERVTVRCYTRGQSESVSENSLKPPSAAASTRARDGVREASSFQTVSEG